MSRQSDPLEQPKRRRPARVAKEAAARGSLGANSNAEQEKAAAIRQLELFARDLKVAYVAEKRKSRELERSYREMVRRLMRAARMKDRETGAHILRLSAYSGALARHLGLPGEEVERIAEAAPLHDLGKIGVPDSVLQKPGPLSAQEWDMMKRHSAFGASLLKGSASPLLETARLIALTHHERWDGTGYPRGIRGEQIPLCGRIVMLADQYDALRSPRCYKPAFSHLEARDILLNGNDRTSPQHFDPLVLAAFGSLQREFEAIYERIRD